MRGGKWEGGKDGGEGRGSRRERRVEGGEIGEERRRGGEGTVLSSSYITVFLSDSFLDWFPRTAGD